MTGKKGVGTQNDDLMRITLGFNFDKVSGFLRYNLVDRVDVGMKEKGNGDKKKFSSAKVFRSVPEALSIISPRTWVSQLR